MGTNQIAEMINTGTKQIIKSKEMEKERIYEEYEIKNGFQHPEKQAFLDEQERHKAVEKSNEDIQNMINSFNWRDETSSNLSGDERLAFDKCVNIHGIEATRAKMEELENNVFQTFAELSGFSNPIEQSTYLKQDRDNFLKTITDLTATLEKEQHNELLREFIELVKSRFK